MAVLSSFGKARSKIIYVTPTKMSWVSAYLWKTRIPAFLSLCYIYYCAAFKYLLNISDFSFVARSYFFSVAFRVDCVCVFVCVNGKGFTSSVLHMFLFI